MFLTFLCHTFHYHLPQALPLDQRFTALEVHEQMPATFFNYLRTIDHEANTNFFRFLTRYIPAVRSSFRVQCSGFFSFRSRNQLLFSETLVGGFSPVFPNLFVASAPFSDKQISIPPLPCLAHMSTKFFRIAYFGCLKMIKTRMSAKMHFAMKLNLVN